MAPPFSGPRSARTTIRPPSPWDTPIKNPGAGAAMMRIEAARRVFPRCWFNESTTEAGRDALGYYHENQDEKRSVGLGPEHDWSSHAADAFGYMAIAYEEPPAKSMAIRRPSPPRIGSRLVCLTRGLYLRGVGPLDFWDSISGTLGAQSNLIAT